MTTATPSCTPPARAWRAASTSATPPCRWRRTPTAPAAWPRPRWCEPSPPHPAAGALRRGDRAFRAARPDPAATPRQGGQGGQRADRRTPGAGKHRPASRAAGLAAWGQRRRKPVAAAADRRPASATPDRSTSCSPPARSPRPPLLAHRLPEGVIHQFAPIDGPGAAARFLDHWRPVAALFVESELWPNLIAAGQGARRDAGPGVGADDRGQRRRLEPAPGRRAPCCRLSTWCCHRTRRRRRA